MKLGLILVFVAAIDCVAQKDCKLKLDKDSIKVYTCVNESSKFKSVKTTFELKGSLPQLAAMVMDIDHLGEWQYLTLSTKLLKKASDRELIYHTEVAAPMFTNNRDFVIHLTLDQDSVTREMTIDLVSIPDYLPRKEGVVRVPFSNARWTVKPLSPSRLSVEYYIEIDIGGAVPAWIVNMVAHQAPYETFKSLRAKIGQHKGRASFIKK